MGDGGIPDAVTLSQCWSQSSFSVLLPQCWQGVSFYPYSMRKNVGGREKKKKRVFLWKSSERAIIRGLGFPAILSLFQENQDGSPAIYKSV